jgi:hypothetical protein
MSSTLYNKLKRGIGHFCHSIVFSDMLIWVTKMTPPPSNKTTPCVSAIFVCATSGFSQWLYYSPWFEIFRSCHSQGRVGKKELLVEQNLLFPLVWHCLFAIYEPYSDVFQVIIFSYHSNFCTRILYMYLIK